MRAVQSLHRVRPVPSPLSPLRVALLVLLVLLASVAGAALMQSVSGGHVNPSPSPSVSSAG